MKFWSKLQLSLPFRYRAEGRYLHESHSLHRFSDVEIPDMRVSLLYENVLFFMLDLLQELPQVVICDNLLLGVIDTFSVGPRNSIGLQVQI